MADQRDLTQEVVETDVNQTDRQRRLFQEIVEVDHDPRLLRDLFQLVVEVDGDWPTGRILSAQFV